MTHMPSSCPNGVCTSAQNGVGKAATNKPVANNRFKNANEPKQHNVKASRGTKTSRGQTQSESNPLNVDGTQSKISKHPINHSNTHSVHNPTDLTKPPCNPDTSDNPEVRMSDNQRYPAQSSTDSLNVSMPINPAKPATAIIPNTVAPPTMYDQALLQSYFAQVQGYSPGLPCSVPHCSTCFPTLDSAAYMSNPGNQPVQPPMLVTRPMLSGMGSTGATGTAPNQCYFLVGQDPEAQKQLYQTQLALSQLSLNSVAPGMNPNYGISSDCSVGVPMIPTSQTVEAGSGASQIMTSSPQSEASMYTPSSVVYPVGTTSSNNPQSRAGSEARFPCPASTNNPIVSTFSYSSNNNTINNSTGNQGMGICVDTTGMDNAMWAGNYLSAAAAATAGTGNMWIPPAYPTYAQQYYPALSVPVASISSPGLLNYEDPNTMQQNSVDRCYSNPSISVGEKYPTCPPEYYYSPGANMSPGSVYTGSAKFPGPKPFAPLQIISPSTSMFSTPIAQTQLCPGASSTNWQTLLTALATQKNNNHTANANLIRHPLSSYHLSLDRARMSGGRKRVPVSLATRTVACKEFNPTELQALNLKVNPVELDTDLLFRTRYFVIKSDCEYNVHQSIRHGVWCSTRSGNQCLNDAYQSVHGQDTMSYTIAPNTGIETQTETMGSTNAGELDKLNTQLRGHILLFFSVRSSGYVNGVAEMIGPVDTQERCTIWQDSRFRGKIPVRWIYVKNVPTHLIKHILIESYDNRPVTVLRDTSEITPASKGEELLRIIHGYGLPRSMCLQQPY